MPLLRSFALLVLSFSLAAAQDPAVPDTTPPAAAEATTPAAVPAEGATPAVVTPPPAVVTPPPAGVTPPAVKTPPTIPGKTPPTIPGKNPSGIPGKTPPGGAAKTPPLPAVPLVPSRKPARDPNVPLADTKIVEAIEQASLKGSELAALYRKYTGRRVIVSAAAAAAEFSFMQDASPEEPLTYAEAAELLRKAAGIENFVFMPDDQDKNLDFLTVSTRLPGLAYNVFNENDLLPEGEGVISYVMTFKHLKPETAAQAFTQIIGQFGTYGSIAPLNGSVVITENTSLIRRLIKLKEEIDKPADITSTRFISVKYADVTELAGTLNDLLNTQQQAQKTAAVQRAGAPAAAPVPGAPPQAAANTINSGAATSVDTPVQIIPEPRTNRIFGMGRPVDLLFVEGLIREFDIETSEKTFLRRKLKFLTVTDFLPIASDALNRAFTSPTGGATGAQGAQGAVGSNASRTNRSGSNTGSTGNNNNMGRSNSAGASSFGGGTSSFGGGSGGMGSMGGSSGGMGGGSSLGNPNASTAPESRLVGRTLLVADNITNSIVVQGPPSGLEIIERLLDQIDVKADQVMISTVIGQLTLDDSKTFGADYTFNDGSSNSALRGGGGFSPSMPIVPIPSTTTGGTATTYNPGALSGAGGLQVYGKIGNNLNVFVQALQSTGKFTVLSRPSVFTANNQKGTISSGRRVAIPTNSNSFTNGGASTNIQYQDVVLKLEVIPLINSKDEITLQIALLDDEVNGNQTIAGAGANGTTLTVPNIFTRQVLTTVTIPNNETIVLGGLIKDSKSDSVDGIPILSSIPFLGKLFSNTIKANTREELLIFLQPSIITSRASLDSAQSDAARRYQGSRETRKFADGPEVLPPPGSAKPAADSATPPKAVPVDPQPAATPSATTPAKTKKSIQPSRN